MSFNTEVFDTNSNFSSSRYTAPVAGFYMIMAANYIQGQSNFSRVDLYKNGVILSTIAAMKGDATQDVMISGQAIVQLTASDYIEIYHAHVGGGSQTLYGSASSYVVTSFSGFLVSRT